MRADVYLPPAIVDFVREDVGVSLIEIALLVSLIAVVLFIAVLALRRNT